ncbi:MAG: DUF4097 domain-containing protein [Chloroflexi bacterium]|nr:MAG: DUF4097 domain-containing protein [Chloroflexota bacterium]
MNQQTFTVGIAPRVIITQVQGDLSVQVWKEQAISVETDDTVGGFEQEGNTLTIIDCDGDLKLKVPEDTGIKATNVMGNAEIEGIRRAELENVAGDVTLNNISGDAELENVGEAIELTNLGGDLEATNSPALRVRHSVGGDATLKKVAFVEIETVGGDLSVEEAESALVSTVGGDLDATDVVAALRCGVVSGDCQVQGSARTDIVVGNTGGDFTASSAASVHTGNVGGDCELRDVQDDVEVGYVGGDVSFKGVGGTLQVGNCGGDAELKGIQGSIEVGSIGGDLELQAAFPVDTRTRLIVGGDATITLPDNPDLSIRATVGGDVRGRSIITGRGGNLVNLVYGNGAAHLDLNVGGDLNLKGAGTPRSSSSASGSWNDFGREMSKLGRDLGKLGQELSHEIAAVFNEAGWSRGADFAGDIARKADEQARRAQRRAEEQTRRANERAARVNVRINDREWRLDPERLDRIREQARRAAEEGVSGALEAVERAVSNLGMPVTPPPPVSPTPPPMPGGPGPVPPMPPRPDWPMPNSQEGTAQGGPVEQQGQQGDNVDAGAPKVSALDVEQEREAILRMIAEGRITPEEGDLLLEALGS